MVCVCICGLGHAGLPLAVLFDEAGHRVVGYDVDDDRLDSLRQGTDPRATVPEDALRGADIRFRSDPACIERSHYVLVAVPTPVEDGTADLTAIESAARTIGRQLSPGTTVVLESTIYPGGTREVFRSTIAEETDLTVGEEFHVGYSPERIVPGEPFRDLRETVKVVAARDESTAADLATLYRTVFEDVYRASSIEVAEAAKCFENTQRDVNIALVNELAMACQDDAIDTDAVLDAAGTKWNFHEYEPGLVGGHCVPVDPYHLLQRFEGNGESMSLVRTAREVNDGLADHVSTLVIESIARRRRELERSRDSGTDAFADGGRAGDESVLVAGLAYKPDVSDLRSGPVASIIEDLRAAPFEVVGYDPHADDEALAERYGIPVQSELSPEGFGGLAVLTAHEEFRGLDVSTLIERMARLPVVVDLKGVLNGTDAESHEYIYRQL